MSSPPRQRQSPSKRQSLGSGHRGLPKTAQTPRQGYTQTPNLGTSAIYINDPSIIIEKHQEIQKMLAHYKEELEKYKKNSEDVDYDSLLQHYKIIKAKITEFDTTYRQEYERMCNTVLYLEEDKAKHERARINPVDFPYTKRELPPLEKFEDPEKPEEPEKPSFLERVMGCCSCRKNTNKFKSKSKSKKSKKSKKSSKKGKKGKKTQKSK